jgi:hypothetical protein
MKKLLIEVAKNDGPGLDYVWALLLLDTTPTGRTQPGDVILGTTSLDEGEATSERAAVMAAVHSSEDYTRETYPQDFSRRTVVLRTHPHTEEL